jgi:hypothetical protein
MISRNLASNLKFFAHRARRPVTEAASMLALTTSFIAFSFSLAEKRIYINLNHIPNPIGARLFICRSIQACLPTIYGVGLAGVHLLGLGRTAAIIAA